MVLSQTRLPPPSFTGIFNDGQAIKNQNLQDLSQVPGIVYIVKVEAIEYNKSKYTLVDPNGSIFLLRMGNFELMDISEEIHAKDTVSEVTFRDYNGNQICKERIKTGGRAEIMMKQLLELFKGLDEAGSYSLYQRLSHLHEVESENVRLKEQIADLKSKVNN